MGNQIKRIVETCVYVYKLLDDVPHVLLKYKFKDPNKDRWVPLGAEVGLDEAPYTNALKELKAVGVNASQIELRGLVTEIFPAEGQWILVIYVAREFEGDLKMNFDDGYVEWKAINSLSVLPKPQSDAIFGPEVLNLEKPPYEATMIFDSTNKLMRVERLNDSI